MSNSIQSIAQGSILDTAQQNGTSIAESFANAAVIILVDTSSSMCTCDSRGGQSRYDVAVEELQGLQKTMPGKLAVLSFSSDVAFCPNGIPTFFCERTNLRRALDFARMADVPGMRFILISDGDPDDPMGAMEAARKFKNKIDVIYVGSELSASGRSFLIELSKASGGQLITADRANELQAKTIKLLTGSR